MNAPAAPYLPPIALRPVDPACVIGEYDYAHPVFDLAAIKAQARMHEVQGQRATWFAGAWMGFGFHEDGLKAGLAAGHAVRAQAKTGPSDTAAPTRPLEVMA